MNMMNFGDEMKRLTGDVMTAYDVRMKGLGQLVLDTHETVKGFANERAKMHKAQAKMGKEYADQLKAFAENLHSSVEKMLKTFRENHKEMSEEQAKHLTDFFQDIAKYVSSALNTYQKERGKAVKVIKDYVKHRLHEFTAARSDMSELLKKALGEYVSGIQDDVQKFQNSTRKVMNGYHNDMKHAHSAWKNMSGTINTMRQAGFAPDIKVGGAGMTTVEEAIKKSAHHTKGAYKKVHKSKNSARRAKRS